MEERAENVLEEEIANLEVFLLGNVINYKALISQEWQKVGVRNKQGRDFLSS